VEPAVVAAELIQDAARDLGVVFAGKLRQRAQAEAAALPSLCHTRLMLLRERQTALTKELAEAHDGKRRLAIKRARGFIEQAITNLEKACG
jgi:ribosomal protein L10